MNFKDMLDKLNLLSEATKETPTGRVHKAEPGGYGRKFDDDEDDEKKEKKPEVKRGRGRPKKGSDDSGEVKTYGGAKELQSFMVGNIPKSKELEKLPKKKHSLKEWVQEIEEKYVAEAVPPGMKPMAILDPMNKEAGAGVLSSTNPAVQKMLGGLDPKDVKIVMTKQTTAPTTGASAAGVTGQAPAGQTQVREKWAGDAEVKSTGEYAGKSVEELKSMLAKLHKSGPHKRGSAEEKKMHQINFALRAKGGWKKGEGAAKRDMAEAEIPSDQVDMGAGLGAGRSQTTLEGLSASAMPKYQVCKDDKVLKTFDSKAEADKFAKTKEGCTVKKKTPVDVKEAAKPDFLDLDKDGNKKESMKKAAADKKKKVNESMHKHNAAKLMGKAHALAKEGYNCKYEDMEEAKAYHEGYKEGLDECYGMMPIRGVVVGETGMPAATVPGMAQQAMPAMEDDMDEGNAFTAALARTPHGGKFSVGGKTFTDKTNYDAKLDEFAFESLDKQLNALLTEGEQVDEGLSVSISKGQQGAPDSVSVTAQDAEAEKLMNFIKHVGLGVFGGEEQSDYGAPTSAHGDIKVVDDHDGMMAMMKKMAGLGAGDESADYKDEEDHDHSHEEVCDECGYMESECGCDKEMVDEVETPDQMTDEVAEANAPDSDEAETSADEEAEAQEDAALAQATQQNKTTTVNEDGDEASEEGPESKEGETEEDAEEVSEGQQLDEWANEAGKDGTDASFMRDIEFMTKVIAGGLNKPKSTGQTTIPVIAHQDARTGDEDVMAWKKLAGLTK